VGLKRIKRGCTLKEVRFADITPNVVWYLFDKCGLTNPPESFEVELQLLFQKVYPQEPSFLIQQDGYNPFIIGYDHSSSLAVMHIAGLLAELKKSQPQCKVAMEILPPQAYIWIADFLRDETEYNEQGTIWGKKPSEGQVADLKEYRSKLTQGLGQALLLWLLENKFTVTSVESPSAMDWINQDEYDSRFIEGRAGKITGTPWYQLRPFYTAIRRDIYGLSVLAKERPDIICVGIYHAIKYDFLLARDGKRSYYFLSEQFVKKQLNWKLLRKMWKASHELYLSQPPGQ